MQIRPAFLVGQGAGEPGTPDPDELVDIEGEAGHESIQRANDYMAIVGERHGLPKAKSGDLQVLYRAL
jgi:hypothetical protein